jgi:hypothetical protein
MEASTTGVNFTGNLTQSGTALQPVLVSGTNIKTIKSTSILGSGNIAVVTSPSGVAGAIQFSNGSAFASDASNLFWDDTNKRLGIGTNAPSTTEHIKGSGNTSSTSSLLIQNLAGTELLRIRDDGFMLLGETVTYGKSFIASANLSFAGLLFGNNFYSQSDGSTYIGAQTAPSAKLQIKGSGSTSATTSLLVQNSVGSNTFRIRDDGTMLTGGSINVRSQNDNGGFILTRAGQNISITSNVYGNNTSSSVNVNSYGVIIQRDITLSDSNQSAILEINSTTQGVLFPRMTTTQKNAIASPAAGLVVYDSTTNKLCCYNGSTWNDLF